MPVRIVFRDAMRHGSDLWRGPFANIRDPCDDHEVRRSQPLLKFLISDQELKQRLASADFVVIARVTDVRKWTAPEVASVPHRVTEHDPDWHDAVIKIESILKGPKLKKNKLVVRFPQCNDVAWAHAPKFEKHQEGIFFLKKDEVSGAPIALLEGTEVNAYTCLRPGDWLPKSDEARVRSLLKK